MQLTEQLNLFSDTELESIVLPSPFCQHDESPDASSELSASAFAWFDKAPASLSHHLLYEECHSQCTEINVIVTGLRNPHENSSLIRLEPIYSEIVTSYCQPCLKMVTRNWKFHILALQFSSYTRSCLACVTVTLYTHVFVSGMLSGASALPHWALDPVDLKSYSHSDEVLERQKGWAVSASPTDGCDKLRLMEVSS